MSDKIINISLKDISVNNKSKCVVNTKITKNIPGILLIHAHWCGHCKRFLPTYQKLSQVLNTDGKMNLPVLAIESEELNDNNKVNKLNFRGFPTIKFFDQNGVIMDDDYNGDRSLKALLQEICNRYHRCYTA